MHLHILKYIWLWFNCTSPSQERRQELRAPKKNCRRSKSVDDVRLRRNLLNRILSCNFSASLHHKFTVWRDSRDAIGGKEKGIKPKHDLSRRKLIMKNHIFMTTWHFPLYIYFVFFSRARLIQISIYIELMRLRLTPSRESEAAATTQTRAHHLLPPLVFLTSHVIFESN